MKKTISRMLALLLTLVILMSGMSTALASAVQELGSIEDVEKLLFEAVLDVFPTSTLEQQFVYAQYYEEKGNAAAVENLLASLNSEQLIEFTNYKAEHACTCYDEAGNPICEGVEVCECLCHKVDAFEASMSALIEYLERLDIEQAVQHIRKLRFNDALGMYNGFGIGPVVTAGPGSYQSNQVKTKNVAVDNHESTAALDEEGAENPASEAEEALEKLNALQKKAGDDSEIGSLVYDTMNQYVITEDGFQELYTENADFASFALQRTQNNAMQEMTAAINEDISGMLKDASNGISEISTGIQDNIVLKLFNYDKTSLATSYLQFSQSTSYGDYLFINKDRDLDFIEGYSAPSKEGASAVDGEGTVGETKGHVKMNPQIVGGYPQTENGNSLDYLFENPAGVTANGSGLFKRTSDGYYEYDSMYNAAYYDKSAGKFKLYNAPVTPAYAPIQYAETKDDNGTVIGISDIQAGNFLPFNDPIGNVVEYQNIKNETKYKYTVPVDLWFGMSMEFDFFMPRNGQMGSNDMIFDFYGDDDVWVYIDDILVLDIGGTHGSLKGTINFANGTVSYSNTGGADGKSQTINTNLRDIYVNSGKYTTDQITEMFGDGNTFLNYTPHNFKFYYLERGGNISYCKLKFNITPLPAGGLTVNKEIEGNITETTDVEYAFKITKDDGTTVPSADYKVTDTATGIETSGTTGLDGGFKLKAGQTVTFQSLPSKEVYRISEVADDYTECTDWNVQDSSTDTVEEINNEKSARVYVAPEDSDSTVSLITVQNTLKTTSLTVDKDVVNPRPVDADNVYTFEASICHGLDGQTPLTQVEYLQGEGDTVAESLSATDGVFTFTMKAADDPIQFINLPIGATVTITEVNTPASDSVKAVNVADFALTAESTNFANGASVNSYTFTGTMTGTEPSTVTFTNTPMIYDLKIIKRGLWNGGNEHPNLEPYSSTMYHVYCADTNIDMIVAIYGNESVTIRDLPVGTYTVTELTDWSWRYTSSSNRENNQVTLTGTDDSITFTNTRVYDKWLDSDCYAENTFDGTPSDDRRPKQ